MSEEMDDFKKTKSYIFHVRFNFGRSDDMKRFKEEYIQGKRRLPKPRHQRRKKGLLWPSLRLKTKPNQTEGQTRLKAKLAIGTKTPTSGSGSVPRKSQLDKNYLHLFGTSVTYAGKYI